MYPRRTMLGAAALAVTGIATRKGFAQSVAGTVPLADNGQPINILVPTGTFQLVIEPLLVQFARDTGIKVNASAKPIPDIQSAQVLDLSQKTGTYDAIMMDDTWLAQFKSHLLPLQPLVEMDHVDVSDFFPEILKIYNQNGNQYAYPFGTTPWILAYNLGFLNAAGLKPPTTFAELKESAAKLSKDGRYGFIAPFADYGFLTTVWYQYAVNAGLKSFLNAAGNKADLDNAPSLAALNLFEDLYKSGSMPFGTITYDYGATRTSLMSGESAMGVLAMGSYFDVNDPANSKYAGQFRIAANPVLSSSEKPVYLTSGFGIGISRYSKNQLNAWKLEKYLIEKFERPDDSAPANIVKFPNSKTALDRPATAKAFPDGQIEVIRTSAQSPVPRPVTPFYQQIATVIGRNLQNTLAGKVPAKQTLQTAQNEVNKILK